jgi:hypothetical protein
VFESEVLANQHKNQFDLEQNKNPISVASVEILVKSY